VIRSVGEAEHSKGGAMDMAIAVDRLANNGIYRYFCGHSLGMSGRRGGFTPYVTGCRRGLGENLRPTFAQGLPSSNTTSAVKSLLPRISDEPTP
jgi:hypothetical protein